MMRRISRRFREEKDTGFGTSSTMQGGRLLNKDGTYNVIRQGQPIGTRLNHFHDLITMSWWKFNPMVISAYLFINIGFSLLYYWIGVEELGGMIGSSIQDQLLEAFFFSCQTFTTVGYGRVNPVGHSAALVASFESLAGLMSFALATGLLYGRFSRPHARLLFSEQALIAPYQQGTGFMLRFCNLRKNQLIECEAQLMLSVVEEENSRGMRKFYPLNLERSKVNSLALSWTVVHPIDQDSPLQGLGESDLKNMQAEFIFMFKAFDDTYAQAVHARYSYPWHEIKWGAKFVPMYHRADDGDATILELDKVSTYTEVDLPAGANPTPLPVQASE